MQNRLNIMLNLLHIMSPSPHFRNHKKKCYKNQLFFVEFLCFFLEQKLIKLFVKLMALYVE